MAFFDQVARPSRLVLGKKFFHIWFIYTHEGCVLVLHLFVLQSVIYETPYWTFFHSKEVAKKVSACVDKTTDKIGFDKDQ